jgi:ectoine hydroxylase-related dioxygenase (phytanoyl-CoA dioxygenase family)
MLADKGYVVVPGPFGSAELRSALAAINQAVAEAEPHQIHVGSTGTNVRTEGLLDRAPVLSALFTHEPLLQAASENIGSRFRLSAFHLRTVLSGARAQALHQDVAPGGDGWPLIGFIFMVDEFSERNGATRFVPGTENLARMPERLLGGHPAEECACGSPGSMIIFNGSVWHGFGANLTMQPRRSVYGALIPEHAAATRDYRATLPSAVWAQLSGRARNVLLGT